MSAILALLSSVVWGTSDFFGGTLARKRPPIAVIGGSQPFGLVLVAVIAVMFGQWEMQSDVLLYGAVSGAIGLVGLMCFYAALASGRMGIVSPIASLGVMIPLFIGLAKGENLSKLEVFGVAIAILGLVIASGPELSGGAQAKPVILALSAALTFGVAIYFMALGGTINPTMTIVVMRVVQVSIVFVVALSVRHIGGLARSDMPTLILIGTTDAAANLLFATAAAIGLLSITSVLGSLFPVVTVILAGWIHKERLAAIQYCGILATMIGVLSITFGR